MLYTFVLRAVLSMGMGMHVTAELCLSLFTAAQGVPVSIQTALLRRRRQVERQAFGAAIHGSGAVSAAGFAGRQLA